MAEELRLGLRWRRWDWGPLAVVCVSVNVAEWALVTSLDPGRHAVLAPQASAVFPFGVFHDLRWIAVGHNSWWSFAAEVVAMVALRGALTALSVGMVWPPGHRRPRFSRLLVRGVAASALAAVLFAPSVALLYGLAVVPVSWLFLAAVPLALLVAFIVHPAGITAGWWHTTLPWRALGWLAVSFVVLTVSGALISVAPAGVALAVVAAAGVANAWAWAGLVKAWVGGTRAQVGFPVVPVALAALVAVVAVGALAGFARAQPHSPPAAKAQPALGGAQAVLVVSGYGSTWDGRPIHPIPGRFAERPFSYRGLAVDGTPLPYGSQDTVKALSRLDAMMVEQIDALARASGRPVDVVAESEGALVAKTALLAHPTSPVSVLVMASPLLVLDQVTYPGPDRSGWGVATAKLMTLVGKAFQSAAAVDLSPDSSFLRSVNRQRDVLTGAMACPLEGVRQVAILALADATATPPNAASNLDTVVVSAFHGGLVGTQHTQQLVAGVLAGRPAPATPLLSVAEGVIRSAAAPWQVPTWGATTSKSCQQDGAALAAAASGS